MLVLLLHSMPFWSADRSTNDGTGSSDHPTHMNHVSYITRCPGGTRKATLPHFEHKRTISDSQTNIYPFLPNRSPTTPTPSNTITSYNNSTWIENHSSCHDWIVGWLVRQSFTRRIYGPGTLSGGLGMHSTSRIQIYLLCAMAAMVLVLLCCCGFTVVRFY